MKIMILITLTFLSVKIFAGDDKKPKKGQGSTPECNYLLDDPLKNTSYKNSSNYIDKTINEALEATESDILDNLLAQALGYFATASLAAKKGSLDSADAPKLFHGLGTNHSNGTSFGESFPDMSEQTWDLINQLQGNSLMSRYFFESIVRDFFIKNYSELYDKNESPGDQDLYSMEFIVSYTALHKDRLEQLGYDRNGSEITYADYFLKKNGLKLKDIAFEDETIKKHQDQVGAILKRIRESKGPTKMDFQKELGMTMDEFLQKDLRVNLALVEKQRTFD